MRPTLKLKRTSWLPLGLAVLCSCGGLPGPDGGPALTTQLAVIAREGGRPALFIGRIGGATRRVSLTGAKELPGNHPDVPVRDDGVMALGPLKWSPDGQRLAVVVTMGNDQSEVVVVEADGSGARVASLNTQVVTSGLDWSEDGDLIAYAMSTERLATASELFVTSLSEQSRRQLTFGSTADFYGAEVRFDPEAAHVNALHWTGRLVGLERGTELVRVDVATGERAVVAGGLSGDASGLTRAGDALLTRRDQSGARLTRRDLATGVETELVPASATLRYGQLDVNGSTVLVVSDSARGAAVETMPLTGGARTALDVATSTSGVDLWVPAPGSTLVGL